MQQPPQRTGALLKPCDDRDTTTNTTKVDLLASSASIRESAQFRSVFDGTSSHRRAGASSRKYIEKPFDRKRLTRRSFFIRLVLLSSSTSSLCCWYISTLCFTVLFINHTQSCTPVDASLKCWNSTDLTIQTQCVFLRKKSERKIIGEFQIFT